MAKPLKVLSAADPFAALVALSDVLEGKSALFIHPHKSNEVFDASSLPKEVEDDVALLVESSGSTGTPKRIPISLKALKYSAWAQSERLGPDGQWLLALPINFIAGIQVLVRSLIAQTQPVMMNTQVPFTAESFLRSATLMSGEIKYASLVPTQLDRLLDRALEDEQAKKTLQGFRALLVGGQAVPKQLTDTARKLGIKVVVSYGMTETCGGCVFDSVPLDGVRLRIGSDSRLQIQGPVLAQNPNEWLVTNDLADLDAHGRLRILGRADRVIVSGGLKVSLDAIEQLALTLNGVEEASATSLENQEFGESVGIAYVGSPEVADTIANALVAELGVASKPVRIIRVDRLPKTATGKTDLVQVAQLFRKK